MATGTVAFELQLPVQSKSTLYSQPGEAAAGLPEVVAVARACDSAGFAYIAVCDHVAIPAPLTAAMGPTRWDTVSTLSYLAAATQRVRPLSHVHLLPYRHPLVVPHARTPPHAARKSHV